VDLDEISYGGDEIDDNLDSILLNSVALTISKWRTFKFLRWAQLLKRPVDLEVMALNITSTTYCYMLLLRQHFVT
jgi:hypothetical protein